MKILSAFFICLVIKVHGQGSIDLATLSYRYGLPQPMENGIGTGIEQAGMVNMKIPIEFSKVIWFSDFTYQKYQVEYTATQSGIQPININAFILQTGLIKRWDDQRAIQLLLVPRLMTDFQDVSSRHFQLGGIGMYEFKYHDELTMRYGLMYNRELSGHLFVPIVYLDWKIGEKWSVNATLPISSKVSFQANDQLSFGLNHFGLITSYQIGNPDFSPDYMERISIDFNAFLRYRLMGNIFIEPRLGYALGRSYYQYATDDQLDFRVAILSVGDDRVAKNISFDGGMILDIRVVYNLPIPD